MFSSALIRHFSRNSRQLTICHSRQLAISPNPFAVQPRLLFACQTHFAPNLSSDALQTRFDCVRSFSRTCVNERKKKKGQRSSSPPSSPPPPSRIDDGIIDGDEIEKEERINFDYAKVMKPLYHEDGTPDVLYRSVEVKCLAHESPVLDSYQSFVELTTNGLGIPVQVEEPCRVVERKTVLRSAFVHKNIRVQYEWYTFYRLFKFTHLTGSTADTLLEYLQRNMPEGMAMEVTRTRVEPLPAGVEAAKGETPTKEEVFGGRVKYDVDTVKPSPKPDPAKMPDNYEPRSKDEKFDPIPV